MLRRQNHVSLFAFVQGFILTIKTVGKAHSTIDFLEGNLGRFLWYAEREGWPDDARPVDAWKFRKFLSLPIADRRSPLLTW